MSAGGEDACGGDWAGVSDSSFTLAVPEVLVFECLESFETFGCSFLLQMPSPLGNADSPLLQDGGVDAGRLYEYYA